MIEIYTPLRHIQFGHARSASSLSMFNHLGMEHQNMVFLIFIISLTLIVLVADHWHNSNFNCKFVKKPMSQTQLQWLKLCVHICDTLIGNDKDVYINVYVIHLPDSVNIKQVASINSIKTQQPFCQAAPMATIDWLVAKEDKMSLMDNP